MPNEKNTLCPYAHKCGGCQLQGQPYSRQLEAKQRHIETLLGAFGPVSPILGMDEPLHYRNKVVRSFGLDGKRRPVCGIYQSKSHAIVPVESCRIEDTVCAGIARDIFRLLPEFKIQVYDERSGTGFLRHVLLRRGFATGQVMVVLVAVSPIFKLQKPFLKKLLALHPEIRTVVLNINDRFGPVVLGSREKALYGDGYIEDVLCGLRFRISSRSFYQVNPVQTEKLYAAAMELAALTGKETVLDAYCGVGTIGLTASGKAKQVVGVELNRDAVADAIANARLNGVKNCWFTAGDAGKTMEQMAADKIRPDTVFMDPPRAGSDERFLASLIKCAPRQIVYISCNPETLARDLETLRPGGYRPKRIQPVDMFPFTEHIETVVLLSHQDVEYVTVDYEPKSDKYMERVLTTATYGEIKAWVLQEYGLNVSNLYIAQIKEKYGIRERENYNHPKSEGGRVPICPPEKEAAIVAAFRHFRMIKDS